MLERNIELLKQLPKDTLWKYFLMCTEVPRPSKHMEPIRNMLIDLAKDMGLEYDTDTIGNVVIRKPASKGKENADTVILQAHMDMVPSKNDDIQHYWEKDPLNVVLEGNLLKAVGTTLGADNGIGIAACLAVLEDKSLVHGPLECLFTVDEEDDMSGAENLAKYPFLKGKVLVNVDSEEEQSVCMGCAGGFEAIVTLPLDTAPIAADACIYDIKLKGLLGGHTGCDIHLGRGNATLILCRVLGMVPGLSVISLAGGTAINAIPREASARVAFSAGTCAEDLIALRLAYEEVSKEYAHVEHRDGKPVMELAVSRVDGKDNSTVSIDVEASAKALDLISLLPNGVVRMSPDVDGLVETSISASIITIKVGEGKGEVFAHMFGRSSRDSQMTALFSKLQALGRLTGAKVSDNMLDFFPGWTPNKNSLAAKVFEEAHKAVFGKTPHVYAVHAGLECGFIAKAYPELDQVSIGPTVHGAHSPDECLFVDTCAGFMAALKKGLEMLANDK